MSEKKLQIFVTEYARTLHNYAGVEGQDKIIEESRYEISNDLYWFEEKSIDSFEGSSLYGFEIFVDGVCVWSNVKK